MTVGRRSPAAFPRPARPTSTRGCSETRRASGSIRAIAVPVNSHIVHEGESRVDDKTYGDQSDRRWRGSRRASRAGPSNPRGNLWPGQYRCPDWFRDACSGDVQRGPRHLRCAGRPLHDDGRHGLRVPARLARGPAGEPGQLQPLGHDSRQHERSDDPRTRQLVRPPHEREKTDTRDARNQEHRPAAVSVASPTRPVDRGAACGARVDAAESSVSFIF